MTTQMCSLLYLCATQSALLTLHTKLICIHTSVYTCTHAHAHKHTHKHSSTHSYTHVHHTHTQCIMHGMLMCIVTHNLTHAYIPLLVPVCSSVPAGGEATTTFNISPKNALEPVRTLTVTFGSDQLEGIMGHAEVKVVA